VRRSKEELKKGWISPPPNPKWELAGDSKSNLELTIDIVAASLQLKLLYAVGSSGIALLVSELATAIGGNVSGQQFFKSSAQLYIQRTVFGESSIGHDAGSSKNSWHV
jgi:hypothetical protein